MDPTRYWYEIVAPCFARGWMKLNRSQDSRFAWLNPPSPEVALLMQGFFEVFEAH